MNVIELWSEIGSPTSKLFIRSLFVVGTVGLICYSREQAHQPFGTRNCLELYQTEGNDAQMILQDGS